jgi:hypothetical protein
VAGRAAERSRQRDPKHSALSGQAAAMLRHFDGHEFFAFVEAHLYSPSAEASAWSPVKALKWQRDEISPLMLLDAAGRLACPTWIWSWPRRHGKTQWSGNYLLTRCLAYPLQICVVEANSEDQAADTAFFWVLSTIRNSTCFTLRGEGRSRAEARKFRFAPNPKVKGWWSKLKPIEVTIADREVRFSNGSVIRLVTSSEASSYGGKLSVYLRTELWSATQTGSFDGRSGSTGDAWCGLTIVDSTQGQEGGLLDRMTRDGKLARATEGKEGDPAIAVTHVFYKDIDDACASNKAPWLSLTWLRSIARRMPWPTFKRNHLNLATGVGSEVFPAELIRAASATEWSGLLCTRRPAGWSGAFTTKAQWKTLKGMFRGGELRVGFGLDRAMGVARGDRSVVVVVAKGVDERRLGTKNVERDEDGVVEYDQDPSVYLVLAVVAIPRGSGPAIKKLVRMVRRLYGDPVLRFEQYQAKDLRDWAESVGYDDAKACAMTAQAKAAHVMRVGEILHDKRLALPALGAEGKGWSAVLNEELVRYAEIEGEGAVPKYGAERGDVDINIDGQGVRPVRVKDDAAEAFFWALDAVWELDPEDDGGLSL